MAVQSGLCQTWSETPKAGFLTTRLKYSSIITKYLRYLFFCNWRMTAEIIIEKLLIGCFPVI